MEVSGPLKKKIELRLAQAENDEVGGHNRTLNQED
jgi:hypothetical protein